MADPTRQRLLVVDDEEAILETMTFTFEDDYDVLTAATATDALALLEREGPVAVVITDQRMPEITGVEFLTEVFERYPTTGRIILTGFADMDAIIGAINDGHVYAYVTKPWEPDELKQVVRRAVDHYELAVENERLVADLRDSNVFLEAVIDEFETGAVAVDADGVVRAMNRPARRYLGVKDDPRGRPLQEVLNAAVCEAINTATRRIADDDEVDYEELELPVEGGVQLRVSVRPLLGPEKRVLGRVILAKEISHEPLRRRFDEILDGLLTPDGRPACGLRGRPAAPAGTGAGVREGRLAGHGGAGRAPLAHAHGHRVLDRRGRCADRGGLSRRAVPARSHARGHLALAAAEGAAGARQPALGARGVLLRVGRESQAAGSLNGRVRDS